MPEVPVNGRVLEWARKVRGLGIEDAAKLLGIQVDELRAYESGTMKPLVGLLRQMSAKYRINFTSLLMPAPLPIEKRPTDYRLRHAQHSLSIDTLLAIEEVTEALQAFEDIAVDNERIIPSLRIGSAQLDEEPEDVAARERKRFGVSVEEQQTWRDLGDARRKWRRRIEDRGVFTYMIPMPPTEVSGFSLLRDGMGAICVNDRESTEGAKIFTFFHEYCHLLLRQTGISDENSRNRVERFCNEFAGSFLVPKQALVEAIKRLGDIQVPCELSDADVKKLATRFRTSNRAMALRLERTGWLRRVSTREEPGRGIYQWSRLRRSRIRSQIRSKFVLKDSEGYTLQRCFAHSTVG